MPSFGHGAEMDGEDNNLVAMPPSRAARHSLLDEKRRNRSAASAVVQSRNKSRQYLRKLENSYGDGHKGKGTSATGAKAQVNVIPDGRKSHCFQKINDKNANRSTTPGKQAVK